MSEELWMEGDGIQPCLTPFPIWNQAVAPCPVLTFASWPAYRFLRRQVRWSGKFSTVCCDPHKGFVNAAEVHVFLEFPCFPYDATNVDSLISGSYAFSKASLCIWKFSVYVLLKTNLKDFEHYLTSMQLECSCMVIWTFFGIAIRMLHIECSSLTVSSFRILNSSAGLPSPALALFVVMFPKAQLT